MNIMKSSSWGTRVKVQSKGALAKAKAKASYCEAGIHEQLAYANGTMRNAQAAATL